MSEKQFWQFGSADEAEGLTVHAYSSQVGYANPENGYLPVQITEEEYHAIVQAMVDDPTAIGTAGGFLSDAGKVALEELLSQNADRAIAQAGLVERCKADRLAKAGIDVSASEIYNSMYSKLKDYTDDASIVSAASKTHNQINKKYITGADFEDLTEYQIATGDIAGWEVSIADSGSITIDETSEGTRKLAGSVLLESANADLTDYAADELVFEVGYSLEGEFDTGDVVEILVTEDGVERQAVRYTASQLKSKINKLQTESTAITLGTEVFSFAILIECNTGGGAGGGAFENLQLTTLKIVKAGG